MSIIYNGTTISTLKYNNTDISKVIYNGVTVFETYPVSYSRNYIWLPNYTQSAQEEITPYIDNKDYRSQNYENVSVSFIMYKYEVSAIKCMYRKSTTAAAYTSIGSIYYNKSPYIVSKAFTVSDIIKMSSFTAFLVSCGSTNYSAAGVTLTYRYY